MEADMTPELVGAIIAFLLALTTLIKVITDKIKLNSERAATKAERDADSQALHDAVLKHDFLISQLKDSQALTSTVVDDLRDTCAQLNTSIVKLDVNVENLAGALKELKKADQ